MGLYEDLLDLINEEISLDRSRTIAGDTDLLLTRLVDSLGVVEIVAWLEERLDTEIDPLDVTLDNFRTVGAMVAFAGRLEVGYTPTDEP